MPPATIPIQSLILANLQAALALPNGGADYYNSVSFAGTGLDPQDDLGAYPATMIGANGDVGQVLSTSKENRVLWHGRWWWNIEVYGVIQHASGDAQDRLSKLAADIYRAVLVDRTRGGYAIDTEVLGWQFFGPADGTDARPWAGCLVRVFFQTSDTNLVTQ